MQPELVYWVGFRKRADLKYGLFFNGSVVFDICFSVLFFNYFAVRQRNGYSQAGYLPIVYEYPCHFVNHLPGISWGICSKNVIDG